VLDYVQRGVGGGFLGAAGLGSVGMEPDPPAGIGEDGNSPRRERSAAFHLLELLGRERSAAGHGRPYIPERVNRLKDRNRVGATFAFRSWRLP